jgi:hypothetical protein
MKTWRSSSTLFRPRHYKEMDDQLSGPIAFPSSGIGKEAERTSRNGLDVMANRKINAPAVTQIVHPLYSLNSPDSKWKLNFALHSTESSSFGLISSLSHIDCSEGTFLCLIIVVRFAVSRKLPYTYFPSSPPLFTHFKMIELCMSIPFFPEIRCKFRILSV